MTPAASWSPEDYHRAFNRCRDAWEATQHTGYGEAVRLIAGEVAPPESLVRELDKEFVKRTMEEWGEILDRHGVDPPQRLLHLAAGDQLPAERPPLAGRSCHDPTGLQTAAEEGCDWATLSPILSMRCSGLCSASDQ